MAALTAKSDPLPEAEYDAVLARASVLVIDDEPGIRNFLSKILEPRVKRLVLATSPEEATRKLDETHFDLVILDNIMPKMTGLEWVVAQRKLGFFADTILITAYADLETAIAALRAGVNDFVLKPFRANQILGAMVRTLDRKTLRRDNSLLRHALQTDQQPSRLLGASEVMADVRAMLRRLAGLPTPVLLTGASGTGKELAARHLHQISERAAQPFVAVNCATIAPDQIARDLFGAIDDEGTLKPGLFLLADGGVLFLDEVAQMPEQVQSALLRVIEDQRVRPVGAERDIPLNLRFVFATNADLEAEVAAGRFRADLYHRINVMRVHMPDLVDRSEDIVELAAVFMQHFAKGLGMDPLDMDAETLVKLRRYDWPGNVRELRNLIERSVILQAFPPEFSGGTGMSGPAAIENLELVEQRHILQVLDRCNGNRAEAARRLGVSRKTVDRKVAAWSE